jgi:hypothetical protein
MFGAKLELRGRAPAERVHQCAPDDLVDERLIAKPYFRLRRVHVDIERLGRHFDEQVHLRAALFD